MVFDGVNVGPFFVTLRSALAPTVVDAEEVLLLTFVSGVDEATFAVFVKTVPFGVAGGMLAVTLNVAEAPAASEAIEQVTVAPVVQVNTGPVVCDSETNVIPAGSVSLIVTFAASEGPAFATTIV